MSGSSAFSKSSLNIWKFTLHVLLKTGLENFEHYFTSMWDECNCAVVWTFFGIVFFGIGMRTDLFQSCVHCWVFQICWHIECSTFTASSFRVWNSITGILSPPLALFVVILPKAHLTSHSRMSGSRWVITPSWLSGSWRSFLYSSSVYYCHLFLISSLSVRPILFLSFIEPLLCMKCSLGISNFLEEISSLSHSIVFLYFFHWSLWKSFSFFLAILWNSAFKGVYLSFSLLCMQTYIMVSKKQTNMKCYSVYIYLCACVCVLSCFSYFQLFVTL